MTDMWWQVAVAVAGGLAVVWLLLVAALLLAARRAPDPVTLKDVLRLVPDVVRLVRRLAVDATLPRGVRWRLWALLGYLLMPIDLVPDFLPVVGYADDAVAIALVLRSVTRAAGPTALDRHWPGTAEGLAAVRRLVGLPAPTKPPE
ncbi:MAG: YkvA family protein [Terrabacter sp.]